MKRLGVLLLTLFLLTVTSAFAAGLDVESENVESFSSPVSIPVPDSRLFFLRNQAGDTTNTPPGLLSPDPESNSTKVHSKRIDPGGTLPAAGDSYGTVVDQYHYWDTIPFLEDLRVVSPTAELLITETGGGKASQIGAALYECDPDRLQEDPPLPECSRLAVSISSIPDSGGSVSNITTVTFDDFDEIIETGNRIRLVLISTDGSFNIQWGYKENRPASLELTFP